MWISSSLTAGIVLVGVQLKCCSIGERFSRRQEHMVQACSGRGCYVRLSAPVSANFAMINRLEGMSGAPLVRAIY